MNPKPALLWIIVAYFMQGFPYAIAGTLSIILLKSFGLSNAHTTLYSSLLILPWAIKPLWANALEKCCRYRYAVLTCQVLEAFILALIVLTLNLNWQSCIILLMGLAFVGATYDIFSDGLYLHQLSLREQRIFVGPRSLSYQLARITVQGGLITLAGYFIHHFSRVTAWQLTFILLFGISAILFCCQYYLLPRYIRPAQTDTGSSTLLSNFKSFLKIPHIGLFLAFTLLFNFPEAQLQRIIPLYLLDSQGLHMSVSSVGIIVGTLGSIALLLGTILTGILSAKYGTKGFLLPFLGLTMLSNLSYVLLCFIPQQDAFLFAAILIPFAQFCFGLSNTIFMLALMQKIKNETNKMSYYALLTAIMALGFMVFGAISGSLEHALGYVSFFIWIVLSGFIGLFITYKVIKHDHTL